MPSPRPSLRQLLRPGVAAVKANWRPFVLLQLAALAVVIAYYQIDAVREVCDAIGRIKDRGGFFAAIVAGIVAGAFLPEIAKAVAMPGWHLRGRGGEFLFLIALFAEQGVLVDAFYRFNAWLLGDGTDVPTVLAKMLTDQLGFTPFVSLPAIMLMFAWRRNGYSVAGTVREIARAGVGGWYLRRVVPLMLPGWTFWGPMVLLIYSMPGGLQLIMWAAALAAWSLVMVFIGDIAGEDEPLEPADVEPAGVARPVAR